MLGRRALWALSLVLLATGVARSDDSFKGGEFETSGSGSYGPYKGKLSVTATGPATFRVTNEIRYDGGMTQTYAGDATLANGKLRASGPTSAGFLGVLDKKKKDTWTAVYQVGADGVLKSGTWRLKKAGTVGSETVTVWTSEDPVLKGKLIELPENAVVAVNLDDDDKDGGTGADGQVNLVSDKDDTDGVSGEDDLLEFKLRRPATAPVGARFVLSHAAKIAVWRSKTKNPGSRVQPGETFEAKDETFWLEGLDASSGGANETLGAKLVAANGSALVEDQRTVSVARSAFLLLGHGNSGSWALKSWLDGRKVDSRTNPVLVRGKDEKGKPQAWAVYIWNTEKGAKIALSTAGSVIAYDGHSNFGLGYAFETHFSRVSQFMNIADAQVPVNWAYLRDHQDHPTLLFEDSEYGDDTSTASFSDPVAIDRYVKGTNDDYYTRRWPAGGHGGGTRYPLVRGKDYKWDDHHYLLDNDASNARIVVKAGARDMPAKRWSRLFLNSCYAGPYYYDSFGGRGTLFFTHDEASSPQTSKIFIASCIDGKSNESTLDALNQAENINDYHVFGE
ncbi:MAG: hypothetical protein ACAI25_04870 [Planctomycetota bacterium]